MALSVKSSGTQAATLDSTHTLLSTTDAGVYVLSVDTNALAVNTSVSLGYGETVNLDISRKVRTGDTVRSAMGLRVVAGPSLDKIHQSIAVACPFGADFTLQQITTTGSSGRSFPWSVELLGAPTVKSSGSQTCVLDTLHTLLSTSDSGVYCLSLDLNAIAAGEILEVFVDRRVLNGGTVRQLVPIIYTGVVLFPVVQSIPVVAPFGADFKIRQPTTSGASGRAVPWSVEQLN